MFEGMSGGFSSKMLEKEAYMITYYDKTLETPSIVIARTREELAGLLNVFTDPKIKNQIYVIGIQVLGGVKYATEEIEDLKLRLKPSDLEFGVEQNDTEE